MRSFVGLLAAAVLGGGAAFGIGTTVWDGGTTTVLQPAAGSTSSQTPVASDDSPASDAGNGIAGRIYRSASPGVVQVTSNVVSETSLFGEQQGQSLGSGFVIDKAGHVLTNFHVIDGAREVFVNFSGNDRMKAKIVGSDPSTDLAVLQIDAQARALTPLPLGRSNAVRVGDAVVAIGNPFGLDRTVTSGIVSALQREIQAPNGFEIDKVIQTDAAINKGNSGGPLLNAEGEVIGINSQIETESGGNVGIGFAIPIDTVREVTSEIMQTGKVEHPYLGVKMQTIDETLAETVRLDADKGVLLTEVVEGSPADEAGLKGGNTSVVVDGTTYILGGDVITKVDDRGVETADEVREIVTSKEPGDELNLEVQREGSQENITVELGRQPSTSS